MIRPLPIRSLLLALVAGGWLSLSLQATGARLQGRERIFVAIQDAAGEPVTDLTAADLAVRIDGADQQIIGIAHATEPLSVVITTDSLGTNPGYRPADIREALAAFVSAIRHGSPGARIGLLTFDRTLRVRAALTATPVVLDGAVGRLAGTDGSSLLLDVVAQASTLLSAAPSARRVIFNVYAGYLKDASTTAASDVGDRLNASGASLWSVDVERDRALGGSAPSVAREAIVSDGGRLSGGARVTVTSRDQLKPTVERMAKLILSQYEVVYGPASGKKGSQRLLAVRRQNVHVFAPFWVNR